MYVIDLCTSSTLRLCPHSFLILYRVLMWLWCFLFFPVHFYIQLLELFYTPHITHLEWNNTTGSSWATTAPYAAPANTSLQHCMGQQRVQQCTHSSVHTLCIARGTDVDPCRHIQEKETVWLDACTHAAQLVWRRIQDWTAATTITIPQQQSYSY